MESAETMQSGQNDMDYRGKPPSKLKKIPVNFRAHPDLHAQILAVQRLWALEAELEDGMSKEDAEKSVDMTYVCERLLSVAIAGVWKEEGQRLGTPGMPKTPSEWTLLAERLAAAKK